MEKRIYKILDKPWLFELSQRLLAPGAVSSITSHISNVIDKLPAARLILDVGCGPRSWLNRVGLKPVGLDASISYMRAYNPDCGHAVVGSGNALPFRAGSFDGVWSLGLFHHLPDDVAKEGIREFVRICRSPGYVAIFDGVLPKSSWKRPYAALSRRMDRGRFMRRQDHMESLLPDRDKWSVTRFTYSLNGLEGLILLRVND